MAVVNNCNVATNVDSANSLTSYSSEACASNDTIASYVDDVRLEYKIMAQNFNPKTYSQEGQMTHVMKRRFSTDLMLDFSQSMKFSVVENFIRLFDSWFIDIRDFTFFLKSYIDNNPKMNIKTYNYDFLG